MFQFPETANLHKCQIHLTKQYQTIIEQKPTTTGLISSAIQRHLTHFSAQAQRIKKIHPEKISYTLILKNLFYFLRRKLFSYFRKPQKDFLYCLKRKLLLYFGKRKPRKNYLDISKRNSPSLKKEKMPALKKLFTFRETELSRPKL